MTKIMIVEDDPTLRDIYTTRFRAEGYEVVTASDGEAALSIGVQEKPDLILLDIMMPKISGFDVLDILRDTEETKNTKIIVMSALSQTADIEKGKNLGANAYLVKSQVTLSEVVEKVKAILAGS
ncbi:response regulator [Patescibacteria group bacterium]|jgi:DNA-binding response OmpR family regulator|nr:response regulator [Patescibacteria group bacterium]